jgi:Ca-activated chloride channel family protein
MTVRSTPTTDVETSSVAASDDMDREAALGALRSERGNLPLERIDVRAEITGLTSRIELTQDFVNAFDVPLEASYVFPLPDRAAVTRMQLTAGGRVVEAQLRERETARRAYDEAITSGRRAGVAEEDRPDVFTIRAGNILPGQRVSVALTLVNPLTYEDGEATFRFPLVVAPRHIPGGPLPDLAVGDGYADDTEAVPDASRITPPVLLPGFPHPVPVAIDVGIDPAGLTLSEVRSSAHAVSAADGRIRVQTDERADKDFVLRLRYAAGDFTNSLVLVPDEEGDQGTYQLTVLPPVSTAPPRPRDLVLVLDRSSSMAGWKMVAARRAAARIVDTLSGADRFAVLTFGDEIDRPAGLPDGLVEASDRHRYRAVEHLARVDARGGTELLAALRQALVLLRGRRAGDDGDGQQVRDSQDSRDARDSIVAVVTDGQVGNEDQLLCALSSDLRGVRVHTVGIDQAVNAGFLSRFANLGGGRCELVESEERLDEAIHAIARRIGAPLAHSLAVRAEAADGLATIEDTVSPARLPDLFPGTPLVVTGRYRGRAAGSLTLSGTRREGGDWSATVAGQRRAAPAMTAQWARAHLRDLEDRYASVSDEQGGGLTEDLAKRIIDTSLRFGVLCRFTAYVALGGRDSRVVAEGALPHRVMQPVEVPAGWDLAQVTSSGPAVQSQGAADTRSDTRLVTSTAPASAPPAKASSGVSAGKRRSGGESNARTVKLRTVLVLAAVGLLLVGSGWAWSLRRDALTASTRDSSEAATTAPAPDSGGIVPETTAETGKRPPLAPVNGLPAPPPQTPMDGAFKRDIVTNGSVYMVVAAPTQAADRLVSAVTDAGGRVDSRSERSGAPDRSGSAAVNLVLRIPSDKLDGVLADAKKLGAIESMSIAHTDVTSQRVDYDARIEALQTSVTRLLDLMRRASNTADLLAAESTLTQRQAELDSLRAQRAALGDEISYATINVNLSAVPTVTHGGFIGALEHGWRSLISAGRVVVVTVGFLLPWLPVAVVLVLVLVLVLRRKPLPLIPGLSGAAGDAAEEPETES